MGFMLTQRKLVRVRSVASLAQTVGIVSHAPTHVNTAFLTDPATGRVVDMRRLETDGSRWGSTRDRLDRLTSGGLKWLTRGSLKLLDGCVVWIADRATRFRVPDRFTGRN